MAKLDTIRINLPKELKATVKAEAERLGISMRAMAVVALWGYFESPNRGSIKSPNQTHVRRPEAEGRKFVPPSVEEAAAEIKAKGYHFTAEDFVAWNETRGWKTRQGPMKNWRQAMVTWESRWKEKQQAAGGEHGRRVSASEARVEQSKRNIIDGITRAAGGAAATDSGQREGDPIKRIGG